MKRYSFSLNLFFPFLVLAFTLGASLLFNHLLSSHKYTSLIVFPDSTVATSPIEDTYQGGNSKVIQFVRDSTLSFSYTLKSGFAYPYAGANLRLSTDDTGGIDFTPYDSILISISSSTDDAVRIFLKGFLPKLYKADDPSAYLYKEIEYIPSQDDPTKSFPLKSFKLPTWWKLTTGLNDESLPLKRVPFIEIFSGLSRSGSDTVQLELSRIELKGKNRTVSSILLAKNVILWCFIAVFFMSMLIPILKTRLQYKNNRLKMLKLQKPVTLPEPVKSSSRILEYMASHFSNPDLSLLSVARGSGVAKNRVTEEIRSQLNTTFKGYLNQLRLNEAARLLKETSRQITEIALAVGFNNVSHFNRLFKEEFKKSPREYRAYFGKNSQFSDKN